MAHRYYPNPLDKVVLGKDGPQPQPLFAEGNVKVIVAGLAPGQVIPVHPEGLSSFHFMEGTGVMTVDGERMPVGPGTVIVAEHGAARGIEAESKLSFVAVRITQI